MNSPMDGKKRIASLIVFGLALLLSIPVLADGAKKPAIVLVHGAFADGSSWAKVIPILQDGPVILVGHSWAGVVITEAGTDPKVVGLVYVAAFAPDQGEALDDLGKAYPPPPALAAPIVDKEGFLSLSTDAVVKHFASDLPASEARVVAATQVPIAGSAFGAKVSGAAWKTKPSWYIVSKLDSALAPDEERFFAKRMKATTTELNASHVSMLSQPKAVAAVILDAAAKAPVGSTAAAH